MLYSDLIFVLGFFPVLILLSTLDRSAEYKNLLLITGSVLFVSWGKPFYISVILLFSLVDWAISLIMDKKCRNNLQRKILLAADGIFNLSALLFLCRQLSGFSKLNMVLPLCVSGILLRGFMYTYEVYKEKISAEKNYFCLLTYTSNLFMSASGYLPEYKDFEPAVRKRTITPEKFSKGLTKMFLGIGKIVILSDTLGKISEEFAKNTGWIFTLASLCFYFGEGFFLFTGLWDMSAGMGLVCDFDLNDNYSPLNAKDGFSGLIKGFHTGLWQFCEEILQGIGGRLSVVVLPLLFGIFGLCFKQSVEFFLAFFLCGIFVVAEKTKFGESLKKIPAVIRGIYVFLVAVVIFSLCFTGDFSKWAEFLTFKNFTALKINSSVAEVILNNLWVILVSIAVAFKPLNDFFRKKVKTIAEKSVGMYKFVNIMQTIFTGLIFTASVILQF